MLGFARNIVFSGQRTFRCGEKLARVRDGFGRRRFAAESGLICARNVTEGSRRLFSFLLMLCYCVLHVLRYFVHWDRCIKAMCSTVTVVCCNSNYCVPQFNLCRSQWHGCAKASRRVLVLQYCLAILIVVCKSLLADRIGTATSWVWFEC